MLRPRFLLYAFFLIPCTAYAETVRYERLEFEIPAGWRAAPIDSKGRWRDLQPPAEFKDKALVRIFAPLSLENKGLEKKLAETAAPFDEGWTRIASVPSKLHISPGGAPIAIRGGLSKDAKGTKAYRLFFGVSAGELMQVILFASIDEATYKALSPKVIAMVWTSQVRFPLGTMEKTKALDAEKTSRELSMYKLRLRLPERIEEKDKLGLGSQNFKWQHKASKNFEARLRLDLHEGYPENSVAFLIRWLRGSDFGFDRYKSDKGVFSNYQDLSLKSGLRVSFIVLKDKVQRSGNFYVFQAALLVYGPGWCLSIGGAISRAGRYARFSQDEAMHCFNTEILPTLRAIMRSVRWSKGAPRARPDLFKRLVTKKRYTYRSTHLSTGWGSSSSSSDSELWTFFADGRCKIESSYFGNYLPTPGLSSGRSTTILADDKKRGTRFKVVELDKKMFLWVTRADGRYSIHSLEFNKKGSYGSSKNFVGLAIDGQIEGIYSSTLRTAFREDPE